MIQSDPFLAKNRRISADLGKNTLVLFKKYDLGIDEIMQTVLKFKTTGKQIAMMNRNRTETAIFPGHPATGFLQSRPDLRNPRRSSGRADIIEERKT